MRARRAPFGAITQRSPPNRTLTGRHWAVFPDGLGNHPARLPAPGLPGPRRARATGRLRVCGGVFAQRAHSANHYGDYPGNNPENHPPCGIMHNQFKTQKFKHLMLAMGPRDLNSAPYSPVHCSSHSMTSLQSSELTELPVVENSQLFAQRVHSARYAPCVARVLPDGLPGQRRGPPFCRCCGANRDTSCFQCL